MVEVNKKLLPVKGHYFLFNAGTAPLVPYLSTYARQLGFSSATVGLIYTVLPIFGLLTKPMFGVIADRFKIQKSVFLFFQIVIIVSFSAIYFIPENVTPLSVEMECGENASSIWSCYKEESMINQCQVETLGKLNTTNCEMACNITTLSAWQTVCEHWHMPEYCYSGVNSIRYDAHISGVQNISECLTINTDTLKLDGLTYYSTCRNADKFEPINEVCSFECFLPALHTLINENTANMTCVNETLQYDLCKYDDMAMYNVMESENLSDCQVSCEISSPYVLMELCESWNAGAAETCQARNVQSLPNYLAFDATLLLSTIYTEDKCVLIEIEEIEMADGAVHYPYCGPKLDYELLRNDFHAFCDIECDNDMINDVFKSAVESKMSDNQYTHQFWLFFVMMIISWIGQAVVVTFADAICFNILGSKISQFGKQRLWGSVGWGIFSLLTGTLIDATSDATYKNYTIAFVLMFVFMCGDFVVSWFIQVQSTKMSLSILADIRSVLKSMRTFIFLMWTVAVGMCTGLLWQFLFWHIEDVSGLSCDGLEYVKTLQGLVSAIQTFGGEIPFMFVSGHVLKKIGHENAMSLVLLTFGLRFVLYSFLTNAWWILPIELFQGITYGMFYPTMTSYANVISPPGTETTVQGLVGAIFEGVGSSLGSFIGGKLYDAYGGWATFRSFGVGAFLACIAHVTALFFIKSKTVRSEMTGVPTRVRLYRRSEAAIHILEAIEEEELSETEL